MFRRGHSCRRLSKGVLSRVPRCQTIGRVLKDVSGPKRCLGKESSRSLMNSYNWYTISLVKVGTFKRLLHLKRLIGSPLEVGLRMEVTRGLRVKEKHKLGK